MSGTSTPSSTSDGGRRTHLVEEWVVGHGNGRGSSVPDLGRGTGPCTEWLVARGSSVVALDPYHL